MEIGDPSDRQAFDVAGWTEVPPDEETLGRAGNDSRLDRDGDRRGLRWALRRFLLVTDSNMIRTCVQGFTALRGAGKPLTCGDGNLRVQERRSAAERGMVGTGVYPVVCPFLKSSCDSGRRSTPTCNGRMPGSAVAGMLGDSR